MMHYTTLSAESKTALQSGNLTKMLIQLKKLHRLHNQGSATTKGQLHRHVIAMSRCVSNHLIDSVNDTMCNASFLPTNNYSTANRETGQFSESTGMCHDKQSKFLETHLEATTFSDPKGSSEYNKPSFLHERDTLYKRKMNDRKTRQTRTKKKSKTDNSLKEAIYKYYYQKLCKVTKMRASPVMPCYTTRAMARIAGFSLEYDTQSYEDKFRNLMYKVKIKWRARDYIQRVCGFESLFCRLCTQIMDCVRNCVSAIGHRLESMDHLDNLFRMLHRFKISSPVFKQKEVYRGGGPKKQKTAKPKFENWGKPDAIGKEKLSVPVVDSLSKVLRVQFKQDHGLSNVCRLYKASRTSGPVSQIIKKFDLRPVPSGKHAVQIHFCGNHYVTSEQKPSGIVVVHDSLVTDLGYKTDLYPQLRYTYEMLNPYNEPPHDLIQYETVQHQRDSTSCGIYAVLRAYFILSNKAYTINPEIGRSYLSDVLESTTFSNFDTFSSNYLINNYIRDQRQLQAKKSASVASSNASIKSFNVSSKTAKMGGLLKYTARQSQQRSRKKTNNPKTKMSNSKTDILAKKSINVTRNEVKKMGRPVEYSAEERKQRDRESKLRYYHKSTATQNSMTSTKKCLDQIPRNTKEALNIHSKRIVMWQEHGPPSKQARLIEDSSDESKKRGRPPKCTPEERKLKNKEKSLKHYHKKRKAKIEKINQKKEKQRKAMKNLRLNAAYREKEKANDREMRYTKRQDATYRDKERAKFTEWHHNRRQDAVYRDEERAKFTEWHRSKRLDNVYRGEERANFTEWHRNRRQDAVYRDEERTKFTEWHRNRRQDDMYREDERVKHITGNTEKMKKMQ